MFECCLGDQFKSKKKTQIGYSLTDLIYLVYFSSPESKAHGRANSIPVTPASVRRLSVNIFKYFSETTGQIKLKFHKETPKDAGTKV